MSLANFFAVWLDKGQPEVPRPRRDLDVPNTLTSVQWNKLTSLAQTATSHALGSLLDQAASKVVVPSRDKSQQKNWKSKACRHFFQWLPHDEQDKITPAASALRSGLMDAACAELLGVEWSAPASSHPEPNADVWLPRAAKPEDTEAPRKNPAHRNKLSTELLARLLEESSTGADALAVLALVQKKLLQKFPDCETSSADCNHCQRIAPALSSFRTKLSGPSLHSFDSTVTIAVDTSRKKVQAWGLPISKEKWRQAKSKDEVIKDKRGRKAKADDPEVVKQVVECIIAHSQESSVWMKSENRNARHLTTSLLSAYWDSNLCSVLAWRQFYKIVKTHCKWASRPKRLTDYCDYCHLYEASILPGLAGIMQRTTKALVSRMPGYFEEYACPHEADKVDELTAMRRFIHAHADSHRLQRDRDLTLKQRLDLHELEAQVCHRMSWELQVAESYRWHKLIAHRQKQTFEKHLQELKPNQILLWSDYKQNLTIPMAHTQTGDMFYGTSRMEMTCWGCIIFRKVGGNLRIKHVIVLSSIIEHSTLVSNLLYKEATKQIEDFDSVTEIIAWSDCGPHYKSYDHCAGWTGDFVEAPPNRSVLLCYFGEKHGKGQVDGLFGEVEGWLSDFLKKKGSRIATVDEMEKVLHSYASRADRQTSRGQYAVVRWEPERKPIGQWVLPKPEFQISKTYCLQIHPGNPRLHVRSTLMEDHTFADTYGQSPLKSFPKVEWETIADREWRRGYFSNTRWDRQKPKLGEDDTIIKRFHEHKRRRMAAPNLENTWARSARKQANRLLIKAQGKVAAHD